MRHHKKMPWIALAAITALPVVSGCDDETLSPPDAFAADPMFARYAALGNSITAGFQSAGINDSTQRQSYAPALAESFGLRIDTDFNIPSLQMPGCPPPLINIFTQTPIATVPGGCALRATPLPQLINNVAIPGAAVIDIFTNIDPASGANPLTTFFLGGKTQLQATAALAPTFVTVWIGNNDVLGALLASDSAGTASLITDPALFASRYAAMMDSLDTMGSIQGGVLIGVAQVVVVPYASAGGAYFVAAGSIPTLTVDVNCLAQAPITGSTDSASVLVPFHYGAPLMGAAAAGVPTTLDCSVPDVVTAPEAAFMIETVEAYNQTIAQEAADRGWAYVDPNPALMSLLQDPTKVRPFPAFDPTDPQHETAPFGTAFSRDGFHPNASTHVLILQEIVDAINAKYGTTITAEQ